MNRKERRSKSKELQASKRVQAIAEVIGPDINEGHLWRYEKPKREAPYKPVPGVDTYPTDELLEDKVKHNLWHHREELYDVIKAIQKLSVHDNREWSWSRNWSCKYVDIRFDMRDGAFTLRNKEGERISLKQLNWQYGVEDGKSEL